MGSEISCHLNGLSGRNAPASRHSGPPSGTNNLPPILFHSVHGENIRLSRELTVAERAESFCKGITFSNRPIQVNERIYIKFTKISSSWSGALRLGFTSTNPASLRPSWLPKYACPDLTNKPGFWAKALNERFAQPDWVVFYYVTESGDVHFGINGDEKGVFFSGVSVSGPLWALIDIYGNTVAIEFLDHRHQLNNSRQHANAGNEGDRLAWATSTLGLEPTTLEVPAVAYRGSNQPMSFHRTHGSCVKLTNDRCVAERSGSTYCRAYVFTSRPLSIGEKLLAQIVHSDESYESSLTFGLTTCNPGNLVPSDFPEDADNLIDRPEYWVVKKNVAEYAGPGDEICFVITDTGEVKFGKNSEPVDTIMYVDHTQQFWVFFDLYGKTVKLRLIGTVPDAISAQSSSGSASPSLSQSACVSSVSRTQVSFNSGCPPPPSGSSLTVRLPPADTSNQSPSRTDGSEDNANNECTVCCEQPIDSVLYACGHMCMCHECAIKQWQGPLGGGQCPICRAVIKDVIKIFRS